MNAKRLSEHNSLFLAPLPICCKCFPGKRTVAWTKRLPYRKIRRNFYADFVLIMMKRINNRTTPRLYRIFITPPYAIMHCISNFAERTRITRNIKAIPVFVRIINNFNFSCMRIRNFYFRIAGFIFQIQKLLFNFKSDVRRESIRRFNSDMMIPKSSKVPT